MSSTELAAADDYQRPSQYIHSIGRRTQRSLSEIATVTMPIGAVSAVSGNVINDSFLETAGISTFALGVCAVGGMLAIARVRSEMKLQYEDAMLRDPENFDMVHDYLHSTEVSFAHERVYKAVIAKQIQPSTDNVAPEAPTLSQQTWSLAELFPNVTERL